MAGFGFTDSALEKKLADLNSSQQSIQTLSLWLIHHRKHHKSIVQVWFRELRKAKPNRKLTFMYLANDVIQNSKKKGPEFSREFSHVLSKAFSHVCSVVVDDKMRNGLARIISVWEERNIYDRILIEEFRDSIQDKKTATKKSSSQDSIKTEKTKEKSEKRQKSKRPWKSVPDHDTYKDVFKKDDKSQLDSEHVSKKKKVHVKEEVEFKIKSPVGDPPDPDNLIKSLQDLENSPSTDAEVREKIASLPPEVSDISLLEKIQNREAAEKLAKQVEEACILLADYNNRLSEEVENRKNVSKMLTDFLHFQKERVSAAEQKAEEYRDKLKRVSQVKNELKSHLQNLPDLTLLPSVTAGLAPLPSAGDLFNQT